MWLRDQRFQRWIGGGFLERFSIRVVSALEMMSLMGHKDLDVTRLIRKVRRERRWLITSNEAFTIYSLARAQARLPGHMAEVGTYEGGSTKMICEAKGDRPFHVFDTFEGMPEPKDGDRIVHHAGAYACSLASVSGYLKQYPNVQFYKGKFPDTASPVENLRFSFVHLDVDLYESTLGCLKFFYPRMEPGGIILSHDYSILAGVRQAFAEYLADKPESLVELPSTQCMVVKQSAPVAV